MDWYQKLSSYFPAHEMKDRAQMEALMADKEGYQKLETDDYILMFAEFPDFILIDYLLVLESTRGKGVGSKALADLKRMKKPILLEVEPVDPKKPDSAKRIRFYQKNGFTLADQIEYIRKDEDGHSFQLHILYWPHHALSQLEVMEMMKRAVEEVHNYRSRTYYGRQLVHPQRALRYRQYQHNGG